MIRWLLSWFGLAPPPWLGPALLVAAFIAVGGAAYLKGLSQASSWCRTKQLQTEIANHQRDVEAAQQGEADAERMARALTEQNDRLTKENEDYEKELAARPDDRCTLTPDDLRRLH